VPVYFLEHHGYFDRPHLYGPPGGAYGDNLERFTFLSRGALELCKGLGWIPDVVHANDWQSALVPIYLNTVEWAQPLHGSASIYSIHNLAYQGVFDPGAIFVAGLGAEHLNAHELEHFGTLNLTKGALYHSTLLSTVSPTYAREIQTGPYGAGLDGVLRERSGDLRGILNGIDTTEWDPATDPRLAANYDARDLSGKAVCKAALQREAGLPVRAEIPLFALVGRLVAQKGVDVLADALPRVLDWDLQFVLLGTGERDVEERLASIANHRPDRCAVKIGFDDALAHRIEAGADFFVMPSRFEPCGLNQMYSLRYGTLPIVRATGGLADSVRNYDEATGEGTGFVLNDLAPDSLADTIGWALATWYQRPQHVQAMRLRAMAQDFSWQRAAGEYRDLYLAAYERRRGHPYRD
jgi:starch synthase